MKLTRSQFFYCYNQKVSNFLKTKGIQYIHIAIEPKSHRLYSLYFINDQLQEALQHYKLSK